METAANQTSAAPEVTLDQAIDALDPVVALNALIQITGDRTLLHQYSEALDGTQHKVKEAFTDFGEDEQEPSEQALQAAAEVRERLRKEVKSDRPAVLPNLDKTLFREMAELAAGTELPEMSLDPAFQHAGFTTDTRVRQPQRVPPSDFKVLVVGAGMMGINAAVKLQQAGFDFTVVEKLNAVGGNWVENTFPGAAVDTPSRIYSYSFEPNASWTKYYPTGPEFLSYLERVTDKYRLWDHIALNTSVEGAEWDDTRQLWRVNATRDGEAIVYEVNALLMAVGPNNEPNYPRVDNLDQFQGPVIHSAKWDHSVDLEDKKVVLVGTGCSGVQVASEIADRVGELVIIQRQPEHILPNPAAHAPVDPLEIKAMEAIPFVAQWKRLQSLVSQLMDMRGMALKDEQYAAETGGFGAINDGMRMMADGYLRSYFGDDPEMMELLTPDYPAFAKRPILDCGFYDTLKKPNVRIVGGALSAADENAVILEDGTRIECDVLLLSTGYKLHFGRQFDIKGKQGKLLKETFDPFPFSYEGMLVPGYPNFIFGAGPYSHLVANHAMVSEQQMHYAVELLQWLVDDGLASVDVTEEAANNFVEIMDADLARSVWVQCGNAHGYYRDQGKKVVLGIPRHNSRTWHVLRSPRQEDFHVTPREDMEPAREPEMITLTV